MAARYCRERTQTPCESAIRPRFVPDSFHSLNTGLSSVFAQVVPVALWYKSKTTGAARLGQGAINAINRQILKDVMERVETRPEADQAELFAYALEIEARHDGPCHATAEEPKGI